VAEVASAYVSLLPSAKGFGSKLNGAIGGDVDKAGKISGGRFGKVFATASIKPFRAFGAAALGFFAVDKVTGFFKDSISAASDAQQSFGATQTVFGKYARTVIKESKSAADAYGLSANDFRESSNLIGALLKNQGVAQDQLAGKTKTLVGLGADLSATYGGTAKEAVEALSSAFKGEFDPLEQYGVSLKQSTINTEAYALANVKTQSAFGKLSVAQQRQFAQQATMKILMQQSAAAQGQFGKQTNTLAEQQQIAAAKFDNLKAKIGTALLPVMTKFFGYLSGTAVPAISTFITQMQTGVGVGGHFAAVFQTLGSNIGTIAPALGVVVAGLVAYKTATALAAAATAIQAAGATAATGAQWSLNAALAANPIGAVVTVLTLLGVGLVIAYKKSQTFRNVVQAAFAVVRVAASAAASALGKIPPFFAKVTAAASSVLSWVKGHWPVLTAILAGPIGIAAGLIISHWRSITTGAQAMFRGVKNTLTKVVTFVAGIPGKITAALGDLGKLLYGAGQRLIGGLIDGIKSKAGDVGSAMSGIAGKIKGFLPGSPVKEGPLKSWNHGNGTSAAGRRLIASLAEGIEAGAPWIKSAMEKVLDTLSKQVDAAKSKLSDLKSQFASVKDGISQAFVGDISSVTATTDDAGAAIAGTITSNFTKQLSDTHGTLGQLTAAFQKLKKWGLGPKFLSQLFQSGNTGLILEMASGDKGAALSDQQLFNQNTTLANQLGASVANNQFGQQINVSKRQLDRLERIDKHIQELDKKFADRINKATVTAKRGRAA
jgi:phage-related protein